MSVYQSIQAAEPFFAPLSRPMLAQALELQAEQFEKEDGVQLLELVQSPYARLRTRMLSPRQQTFELLQPAIRKGEFTSEYLLQQLTRFTPKQGKSPVAPESLSRWREMGIVRYREKNIPDYDSGAALITLRRLVRHRERGWLPTPPKGTQKAHYFDAEPLWWCWRQDGPTSPVLPCPVPLPEDLPASALLWTDWCGASWSPEWYPIGELGCCRWAGIKIVDDKPLWAITEEDLERWKIIISSAYKRALSATPLTLHMLASSALLLLGTERLEEMRAVRLDTLPLAG
jgi:hypothetical protein